ncbi:MAG: ECF transporter S component [Muribaculaceae bacterium]|nr:ECF transporter S component [Muribaculaceae bacterium]
MTDTARLYSLQTTDIRTYIFAALFVIGNIALPQLCHLIPQGGFIFLPIYFFTLIAAYKYGWRVGLLTAILSPLINSALFSMPAVAMLPVIITKSALLALIASFVARRTQSVSILALIAVVLSYQILGGVAEGLITGDALAGLQDFKLGYPGMLIQVFGGYVLLKYVLTK